MICRSTMIWIATVAALSFAPVAVAQERSKVAGTGLSSTGGPGSLDISSGISLDVDQEDASNTGGKFSVVAIPIINPTFGAGAGGAGIYTFGPVSGRSTLAVGGGKTGNGSWVVGAGGNVHLHGDRFRVGLMVGKGKVNLKYFGTGEDSIFADDPVSFSGTGSFVSIKPEIRIAKHLYGGFSVQYMDADISTELPIDVLPELRVPFKFVAGGPVLEYDTRDIFGWPTSGVHIVGTALWYHQQTSIFTVEFDNRFHTFDVSGSAYFGLTDKLVIAGNAKLRGSSENTPFFLKPSLGLRGYSSGEKLDDYAVEIQAEVRWMLSRKFGAVAFGGVGSTGKDLGSLGAISWGAGAGLRYRFSEVDRSAIGFDLARGKKNWAIYFTVGEAF